MLKIELYVLIFYQYNVVNENIVFFFPKHHLRDLLWYNYEKQKIGIFLQLSKRLNMIWFAVLLYNTYKYLPLDKFLIIIWYSINNYLCFLSIQIVENNNYNCAWWSYEICQIESGVIKHEISFNTMERNFMIPWLIEK